MGFSEDDRIRQKNAKFNDENECLPIDTRFRLRELKKDVAFYQEQASQARQILADAAELLSVPDECGEHTHRGYQLDHKDCDSMREMQVRIQAFLQGKV